MSITLASKTKEIVSILVGALGQQVPINNRSFLYQLSVSMASLFVSIDKKAKLSVRENLATSATEVGLREIGRAVLGRDPYDAVSAEITFSIVAVEGTVLAPFTQFVSEETGLTYETQETYIAPVDTETFYVTAKALLGGSDTSVAIGSRMLLGTPITGVASDGVVTSVPVAGVDSEGIEEYRGKILNAERSQGGGGNAWDYRIWAEEVQGVKRAYPYGGKFTASGGVASDNKPSCRTVFVQCSDDIDPDGIAPQYILDEVRSRLITDPENGRYRIPMGVPNGEDFLIVDSVRRILFDVRIYGSSIEWSGDARTALETALYSYFFDILPAVEGVDPQAGRTNVISEVAISNVVHTVLIQYGYSASKVEFSFLGDSVAIGKYALPAGGLAKLVGISYPT